MLSASQLVHDPFLLEKREFFGNEDTNLKHYRITQIAVCGPSAVVTYEHRVGRAIIVAFYTRIDSLFV